LLGTAVRDTEYVLTLDADSIIPPDYTSTLVELMERPEHARTAVAQTPYSAFPGAPGALERLAGATTDMQYIVHQGFTPHHATYWVGANALLRKSALEDIATSAWEGPVEVRKFIQDRTVIEDTVSSIDLVRRGWALHNHPERLAFSATPPDYGALIVQRRRWANGGLIILRKLLRHLVAGPWRVARLLEGFLRVHYLLSIAVTNIALVALLNFLHAALSIGNVALLTYAVRTFVGWRAAREDATPLLARLRTRNLPVRVGA
jgi:cellulose synthase (UDP-forming)